MTEPERWLAVPGYEGRYEVSDLGRVRSLQRKNRRGHSVRGGILKPRLRGRYNTVGLMRDSVPRYFGIHQLVMLAFVGPPPAGMQTRHGPGGRLNNRLPNLSYGTPAQNSHDMIRDGSMMRGRPMVRLSPAIVAECRRRYSLGETQKSLAGEFSIARPAMSAAIRGVSWASVPNPLDVTPKRRGPDGRFTGQLQQALRDAEGESWG